MALRLEIDNGDLMGRVEYTRYLASPDRTPAVLRDRLNLPALLDFTLVPADDKFLVPRRSAYVRLTGLADALPLGGPRVPGPIFTGYLTNEPLTDLLGVRDGGPVYGYRCQATSEEYLLNVKRIGSLTPFLNQTAGAILRFLTEHLQPGRFDLANVADAAFIPFFEAGAERSWSEIAADLAARAGFSYRVLDGQVYFQPVGSQPAGVSVDENEPRFRPDALQVTPLGSPVHNDVTVLGGVEPQAYVQEHFVGDGFASRFILTAPVFGAESSRLLADDFVSSVIDATRWQETDPLDAISLFDGRLNVTGGTGHLGETVLLARQAIELGGQLEIIHGEYEFVSPSTGILGGLYAGSALALADCRIGFEASPIGAGTRLRAVINGVVQPADVILQANHHYVLITRLSGDQPYRTLQTFLSLGAGFGGITVASSVKVALEVQDYDLSGVALPARIVLHEQTLDNLPAFGLYAPINSADLHVVSNFLQITRPIQAHLVTQTPGGAPQIRTLGFGIATHDATITADPHRNQWALEFYEDTIPARGERITLTYRAAGRARAHVVDSASIATEAAVAGDDGVRSVVLTDPQPPPRTSEEAELAAQAYLADHLTPRYEGRYTTWGRFAESFPRSGALLEVRNESRHPAFTALVRSVISEFRELAGEEILHTLEFGEPSRFEDLLARFVPPDNVLSGEEPALAAVDATAVGTSFLADAPGLHLSGFTAAAFDVDTGVAPTSGGHFAVRRSDMGWGSGSQQATSQNLLGTFSTQTFSLPRTARHQIFFVRPISFAGQTSRHSSVLAIHFPLVPTAPQAVTIRFGQDETGKPILAVTVDLAEAATADVDRVELRDEDGVTVLASWEFGQLRQEGNLLRAELVIDNSGSLLRSKTVSAYAANVLGEYSAARIGSATQPQPAKPLLSHGNSTGQMLEILLDTVGEPIVETQIQAIGPGGNFASPAQDILFPGQPEKFNFVATQSGGWGFRARRRDLLGWSPWSSEPQGQIPAQSMVFVVSFFQADELDPSVGAAINGQNLLPNAEFFLGGVAGQEGVHVSRYFALVNAAADGSEVDYSVTTNELRWKAGVNFAAANPGFRSLLSNLGRLLNPGESITFSAALWHTASGSFGHAVRLALRSPSTPSYDQAEDIASGELTGAYRWYSVAFSLPTGQAVPADLSVEVSVVAAAGQALAGDLFCDKVILNRGHRPAAFSLAPWDVLALSWNSSAGSYDLPATLAGGTPRNSDPGNAGLLTGTGTEDLDPGFTSRYFRVTA